MRTIVALTSLAAVFAAPVAARAEDEKPPELTPEQKMARRYPQPVRVGDLIGRAIVDDATSTIGRVQAVVQTGDGKIRLVTPYGGLLGFGSRLAARGGAGRDGGAARPLGGGGGHGSRSVGEGAELVRL